MTAATATRDVPVWVALSSTAHAISYVQAGPWRNRVLQAGPAGGEPLILMAGTGGHLEAYAHNIPAFARRHRVIAYDYPGHGYTTHATADLELPDYVEHLNGLMDALGIDSAHLNGESLGGWVAVKFAAAHPARARKLVLNTPGGTMARPEVMERIRSLSQAAGRRPDRGADPGAAGMADGRPCDRDGRARRDPPGPSTPSRASPSRCGTSCACRTRMSAAATLITDAELAAVPHGAVVVWTSNDPSGPAAAGMEMAEKIRGGRFQHLPGLRCAGCDYRHRARTR